MRRTSGTQPALPVLLSLLVLLALTVVAPPTPSRARPSPSSTPDAPPRGVPVRGAPASDGFRWPLDGVPRVVRPFDPPPEPWLPGHRGVDLAAPDGATVRAAGAGTVLFAGMIANRPVISVSHRGGLRTTYEPVRPAVATGDPVAAGQALGVLLPGHRGCVVDAPACLHWGLRRGEEYLDPLLLLGLGRVRLLPLAAPAGSRPAGPFGRRRARRAKRGQPPKPVSVGREMSGFSSSSTLTSLNVMTRTFFTKRAGRYMSQTQASCISTSK